ncbi:HNH/endonuclease VII fold putative polymorphic toxin [Clostridium kluyveri]|uniref:HNH/endonuclease VII fold putative polymorphic toxin n=1 Tax=Clostridium kluyveri TaxID=1534 RepID=UPI0022461FE5|nr:HNH/endonuclease VII fold putative polymorphic toxin [Clostridium kluyveri]UZQ51681.1 HNH/endonuclease VII fold putative polymorphic toxin [Clostridium kluyveri]
MGTVFTVGGINQSSMPKSIPYKIGELAGDIGSFAFGAAEVGTGAGGELLGFTADGTGVLAPAGVALNAASLGLVTHGGAATIKSAHNFSEDLFTLIKGEGNKTSYVKSIDNIEKIESEQVSRNAAFKQAKRDAGIPNSTQGKKPVQIYDNTSENRIVHEFEVDGQKKYIIEHREDKFGRGPHFHGADDLKGSPLEKGKYNQYPGHYPENFNGYNTK